MNVMVINMKCHWTTKLMHFASAEIRGISDN